MPVNVFAALLLFFIEFSNPMLNTVSPTVFFTDTLHPLLWRWSCSITAGEGVTIPCVNCISFHKWEIK